MTIQDLINQFEIQGEYCIKRWRDDWNDYEIFAKGEEFDIECRKIKKNYLNAKISYMYAANGLLTIEIELN